MSDAPDIDVTMQCPDWLAALPDAEAIARAAAGAALQGQPQASEISLVLADDQFVATLNRDYRGRDEVTNVLSFANDIPPGELPAGAAPVLLGDVVVAFGVTRLEAEGGASGFAHNVSLADHLSHLIIHGVLHLLGHDHQTDGEATRMERLETELLAGLGIADPYRRPPPKPAREHEDCNERRPR
ncbi:MAG: rRNA maturation RNase YbeY [Rhodospirillales bacterium]|mgnify:FL=1|jgi:probable rRNA maturation factor|nr:rRNA maturation RNase YbeY [Rhodospirillaceae bacterium]MDP6429922.1 rRNA maturation RNase YbeY [Rhodospirillales bacterium]MDP6642634.1 rRNA maturation RNase YbeY [Rhodospirillales bacterium]MDP6840562.1 rRNA maturation RNase YbeY [Rhodospirillales bacterium]